MNSKIKIIIISLVLIFSGLVGGAYFYVSKNITPEKIKELTLSNLKEQLPGAETTLGEVDFKFGATLTVNFKLLNIKNSKNKEVLLNLENFSAKIPLWAILMGGGTIDVKINSPQINFTKKGDSNNWLEIVKKSQNANNDSIQNNNSNKYLVGLIAGSSVNFLLNDLSIQYRLDKSNNGVLKINKFLVKDLGLKTSSAIELNSNFNVNLSNQKKLSFHAIVIGELNLSKYILTKELNSSFVITLKDIKKTGVDFKVPSIGSEIKININKNKKISGDLNLSLDNINTASANFTYTEKQTSLSNINLDYQLMNLSNTIGKIDNISFNDSRLNLNGDISIEKQIIKPNLSFKIGPNLSYNFNGENISNSIDGTFKQSLYKVNILTTLFSGKINTSVNGKFEIGKEYKDFSSYPLVSTLIRGENLKIPSKLFQVQNKQTDKASSKVDSTASVKNKKTNSNTPILLPQSDIKFDFKNIDVEKEKLNLLGNIKLRSKYIEGKNIKMNYSKGKGDLNFRTNLNKDKQKTNFNFSLIRFDLNGLKPFLPNIVEGITGEFNGKVNGDVNSALDGSNLSYNVRVDVNAKDGEIKKINLTEQVNSLISGIPVIKDKVKDKNIKVDGNFQKLILVGAFQNSRYAFRKIDFEGVKKKVALKGQGFLIPAPNKGNGELKLDFYDNEGKLKLQKNIGSNYIPLKLIGNDFNLKPDYGYTTKLVAKKALKTKGKETVKKEIKKLLKGKKAKDLLKGLFK